MNSNITGAEGIGAVVLRSDKVWMSTELLNPLDFFRAVLAYIDHCVVIRDSSLLVVDWSGGSPPGCALPIGVSHYPASLGKSTPKCQGGESVGWSYLRFRGNNMVSSWLWNTEAALHLHKGAGGGQSSFSQ